MEFSHEFWECFEYEMGSSWMFLCEVVSFFPLVNVVLIRNIVVVVVVVSSSYLDIKESKSSCKSSEISDFNVLLLEEVENLLRLGIINLEDLRLNQSWVVASIADWTRVIVRVELVEEHFITGYVILLI